MQHLKDTALLIVTIWAALIASNASLMMLVALWPHASEAGIVAEIIAQLIYLLAGVAAGMSLMTHLRWASRFKILAFVPLALATAVVVANAFRISGSEPLISKIGWTVWAQLQLFVLAVGVLVGASLRRYFVRVPEPNKTMEPTR